MKEAFEPPCQSAISIGLTFDFRRDFDCRTRDARCDGAFVVYTRFFFFEEDTGRLIVDFLMWLIVSTTIFAIEFTKEPRCMPPNDEERKRPAADGKPAETGKRSLFAAANCLPTIEGAEIMLAKFSELAFGKVLDLLTGDL